MILFVNIATVIAATAIGCFLVLIAVVKIAEWLGRK